MKNFFFKICLLIYKHYSRGNLYKLTESVISEHVRVGGKIISIGSGGGFSLLLKSKFEEVLEIDIDEKRNPDVVASMEDLSFFQDETVDIIFCFEVLEHVKDSGKAISEAHRVLRKGGVFIGSSPFAFPIHDEPFDFFRFSKYGIEEVFKKFHLVKIHEVGNYLQTVSLLIIRLLVLPGVFTKVIGVILLPVAMILRLISPLIKTKVLPTGYLYVFKR